MDNKIDFKDLWVKQNTNPPLMDELLAKVKYYKKTGLRKLLVANLLLIGTSIFMILIWYKERPQLITTTLGITITILAMFIFLMVYNQLIPALNNLKKDLSNNEYLHQLIVIKNKEIFLQTKMLNLYFIMLPAGMCLFMYEYASLMTTFWAIFTYVAALSWTAFNWFYSRPKTIKKQQAKLDDMIEKFMRINKQFEDA